MLYYRAATTQEGHKKAGHGSFREMWVRAKLKPNEDFRGNWNIKSDDIEKTIQKKSSRTSQQKYGAQL
jgi:hypothetical protein